MAAAGGSGGAPLQTIFIGGLSPSVTELRLRDLLSVFGRVRTLNIVRDMTGQSGYGFVKMEDPSVVDDVVRNLNDLVMDGKKLIVLRAEDPRSGSRRSRVRPREEEEESEDPTQSSRRARTGPSDEEGDIEDPRSFFIREDDPFLRARPMLGRSRTEDPMNGGKRRRPFIGNTSVKLARARRASILRKKRSAKRSKRSKRSMKRSVKRSKRSVKRSVKRSKSRRRRM